MVYAPPHFIAEYRAARKHSIFSSDGWWINRWPFLGWLETFLKVIAWFYASRISAPNFASPDTRSAEIFRTSALTNSAEIWIFLLATALITAAVFDRLFYREIISMVFVLPNNWAHWTVFRALVNGAASKGHGAVSHTDLRIFCWLMFAGDIVKLVFFAVHDFNIANVAKYVLYSLVALFAVLYATILLLDYGYFDSSLETYFGPLNARLPNVQALFTNIGL